MTMAIMIGDFRLYCCVWLSHTTKYGHVRCQDQGHFKRTQCHVCVPVFGSSKRTSATKKCQTSTVISPSATLTFKSTTTWQSSHSHSRRFARRRRILCTASKTVRRKCRAEKRYYIDAVQLQTQTRVVTKQNKSHFYCVLCVILCLCTLCSLSNHYTFCIIINLTVSRIVQRICIYILFIAVVYNVHTRTHRCKYQHYAQTSTYYVILF